MAKTVFLQVRRFGLNVGDPLALTVTPSGTITPNSVTKAQLLAGILVTVSDDALNIVATNSGTCINFVISSILAPPNDCRILDPSASIIQGGYGLLYNWYAATDAKLITPVGWHIPTNAEWNTLSTTLGGNTISGGKMKEIGTTFWQQDPGSTNMSGFSGRGSGWRNEVGSFSGLLGLTYYWAYEQYSSTTGYNRWLSTTDSELHGALSGINKKFGGSLRYVKDDENDPGTVTGNNGIIYHTVKIGSQVWTAENSKETMFRDGSYIPEVTDNTAWGALTTTGLCAYSNNWNNV